MNDFLSEDKVISPATMFTVVEPFTVKALAICVAVALIGSLNENVALLFDS